MSEQVLLGRVALVTGAGRGLGRAHAIALADAGASVVVNDVDSSAARDVVEELTERSRRACVDVTDIASVDGGQRVVAATIDAFGRIDVLVNNAGFADGGGSVEHPIESEIDALLAVHLKAAIGTMAAAFGDMRVRHWGRIVNTVSESALDSRFVGALGYGAAKAALWSATLTAAVEGAEHGITVNGVSPGARTRLNAHLLDAGFRGGTPVNLDLDPAHVAAVVVHLASPEAGDINGHIIHAAGGHVREYETTRTSHSPLVTRLASALRMAQGA